LIPLRKMIAKTIFLAYTTPEHEALREQMMFTLFKAGFSVVPSTELPSDEQKLKSEIVNAIKSAGCSIHIVGSEYGRTLSSENNMSLAEWQFNECRKQSGEDKFKVFIWQPVHVDHVSDPRQEDFLISLQHNIEANMTYTNTPSTIQLADDIRSVLEVSEKPELHLNHTEIFFVSNFMDENTAVEITDMLSDVTEIEKLLIDQDSGKDYSEITSQQMLKSKLAVVYFKESADWAIPFAQQVWKKIGGASASTPILVIGDEDPESNKEKKFTAPRVVSMVVAGELIPLEIKMQYDKATEA